MVAVELPEPVRQADAAGGIVTEHLADQAGRAHAVLVADIGSGEIAVAFLKAEHVAVPAALRLQAADLLADELEAGEHVDGFHAVARRDALGHVRGHDGLDHHRVRGHCPMLRALRADVIQKQHARFIAGEQRVSAAAVPHGHAHPVAVRVGGQQQVRAAPAGIGDAQLHGLPNLRVGIGAGGKTAVRQALLLHQRKTGVAQLLQRTGDGHIARSVQGAVDDGDILANRLAIEDGLRLHRLQEGREHLVGNEAYPPVAHTGVKIVLLHAVKEIPFLNFGEDFGGGFNSHLAAVRAVDLVAVVLGGIVGGGDHHARGRAEKARGKGHGGHRGELRPEVHLHAVSGQHARGHARECIAFETAVIADDGGGSGEALVEVVRQPLRSPGDGIDVHAVGPRADHAAQPAGSKGEVAVKGVLDGRFVHAPELLKKLRIGHARQPALILLPVIHGVSSSFPSGWRAVRLKQNIS